MADAEVTYETKSVRAIRGMESRTVAKWEAEGWELVSQTPGKLQTELILRRPKPKSRRLLFALVGGGVAVVLAGVVTLGVISEQGTAVSESASPAASESESTSTPSEAASAETAQPAQPSAVPEAVTLTPENNAELAALLGLGDYCDPSIAAFAATYAGQTIEFPGNISAMGPHGSATTRYDILIGAGDYSETSSRGPAFQFRDVNTTNDMHYVGPTPDTIGVRTNLVVTAEVVEYEQSSCLFLLDPVSTVVR
jgi:hypothetical protein